MLGAHAPAWGAQGAQHAPAKTQAHATGDMKLPERGIVWVGNMCRYTYIL